MIISHNKRRRVLALAAALAVLAALYVATGKLGLSLSHYHPNATLIWPPTGLSLAALILFGRKLWPGVFIGALVVALGRGSGAWPALGIATGNTLEALVGVMVLQRMGFRPGLSRIQDVVTFVFIGALGCTMASATIGVASLSLSGELEPADAGRVWTTWWLGNAGGALVVAPLILLGVHGQPAWRALARQRESWIVLTCVTLGSVVAFTGWTEGPWSLLAAFVPFPFLVWAGARLGSRGAIVAAGLTIAFAAFGTGRDLGPFGDDEPHTNVMLLWAYGITIGTAAMILAAAIAERQLAEEQRREEETNRLRLERKMNRAQRLESLGVLAGGVAHDFNNILVAIQGNADLLTCYVEENPDAKDLVEQVLHASDRAAELCRHLLAYAGHRRPTKEPVRLQSLIDDTDSLLGSSVSKRVVIQNEVSPGDSIVDGDPTLLRQVAMNLVLNGAEAIEEGDGTVTVTTGERELDADDLSHMVAAEHASPGRFVFFEVRDDGVGMTPQTVRADVRPILQHQVSGARPRSRRGAGHCAGAPRRDRNPQRARGRHGRSHLPDSIDRSGAHHRTERTSTDRER